MGGNAEGQGLLPVLVGAGCEQEFLTAKVPTSGVLHSEINDRVHGIQ